MGADDVAASLASAAPKAEFVRNGSRGMLWLEPLVEVETDKGRVAYGPVTVDDIESLIDSGMLEGKPHELCHGLPKR